MKGKGRFVRRQVGREGGREGETGVSEEKGERGVDGGRVSEVKGGRVGYGIRQRNRNE